MDNLQTRKAAFLFGCLGTRSFLTYLAKTNPPSPSVARLALVPAASFAFFYLTQSPALGFPETTVPRWHSLRPVHAALWAAFAYAAAHQHTDAWKILFVDTLLGAVAWYGRQTAAP